MNYIRKADAPFVLNNASCMNVPACVCVCVCMHVSAPFPYAHHSGYVGLHGCYWTGGVIFEPWPHSGWCPLGRSIIRKRNKKLHGNKKALRTVHCSPLARIMSSSVNQIWFAALHALNIYDTVICECTHTYAGTHKPTSKRTSNYVIRNVVR